MIEPMSQLQGMCSGHGYNDAGASGIERELHVGDEAVTAAGLCIKAAPILHLTAYALLLEGSSMLFSVARRCVPWRSWCVTGCWPTEKAWSSSGVASSLGGVPPIFVMICTSTEL